MKWITRSHVHVDRVACPWLISRFVDSSAEFIFAPASLVQDQAGQMEATPFDVPGVQLGHKDDKCSFDAVIEAFGLKDAAVLRLAEIVRAADTGHYENDPLAAGLEAIATGYSLRYPDDHENLCRQFEVYDALYAWCRLETVKHVK